MRDTTNVTLQTERPMRPSDYGSPEHNVPALVYAFALTTLICIAVCGALGLL